MFAADELKNYEVWITGEVFVDKKDRLLFRADKPVQGNTTGNIVRLGATKEGANFFLPLYSKAADRHMKLRLYGLLVPDPDANDPKSPSISFITWKAHLRNEPDDLPSDQKIIVRPNDRVRGYKVAVKKKPRGV